MANQRLKIVKEHLILCEGIDEFNFLIAYLNSSALAHESFYSNDIQVMNFGGNSELSRFITALKRMEGFSNVRSIMVFRDAETNASQAVQQIQSAFAQNQLPVSHGPACWSGEDLKTGFVLLPSCSNEATEGTLEDLCMSILAEENSECILEDIDEFMCKLKEYYNRQYPHKFKTQLHTYFSVTDSYVSLKIGEAAKAGAFDWEHEKLKPLRGFIQELYEKGQN